MGKTRRTRNTVAELERLAGEMLYEATGTLPSYAFLCHQFVDAQRRWKRARSAKAKAAALESALEHARELLPYELGKRKSYDVKASGNFEGRLVIIEADADAEPDD